MYSLRPPALKSILGNTNEYLGLSLNPSRNYQSCPWPLLGPIKHALTPIRNPAPPHHGLHFQAAMTGRRLIQCHFQGRIKVLLNSGSLSGPDGDQSQNISRKYVCLILLLLSWHWWYLTGLQIIVLALQLYYKARAFFPPHLTLFNCNVFGAVHREDYTLLAN